MSFLGKHKSAVSDYTGKYVIWSPESNLSVTYVYDSRPDAIRVAYEMAEKYPGQKFLVMKAVGLAQTRKVEFVDLEAAKAAAKRRPTKKDPLAADALAYVTGGRE